MHCEYKMLPKDTISMAIRFSKVKGVFYSYVWTFHGKLIRVPQRQSAVHDMNHPGQVKCKKCF